MKFSSSSNRGAWSRKIERFLHAERQARMECGCANDVKMRRPRYDFGGSSIAR
jgi:hypothetical protein